MLSHDADPREILAAYLMKVGLDRHRAIIIALDAGSSQGPVNKQYVNELNLTEAQKKLVLEYVCRFYSGDLEGEPE